MPTIIFHNSDGIPTAQLLVSAPAPTQRFCVFAMIPIAAAYTSRAGEILLPDRPHEYACDYRENARRTEISFQNQSGWRIRTTLDAEGEGEWSAEKDGERLAGFAERFIAASCAA
jgi:hypothetical protein